MAFFAAAKGEDFGSLALVLGTQEFGLRMERKSSDEVDHVSGAKEESQVKSEGKGEAKDGPSAKQADAKSADYTDSYSANMALLWRAVDFITKDLLLKLDDYFKKYVPDFDPGSDEHRLAYTDAYKEYERLFDFHLTGFAEKEGFTNAEFYDVRRTQNTLNDRRLLLWLLNSTSVEPRQTPKQSRRW
jgi:hypothetical protein